MLRKFGDMKSITVDVVFLAGGRGTRLGALTKTMPKPLVEVGSRPFIHYPMDHLTSSGMVRKFIMCTGYLADQFNVLGTHFKSVPIQYSREQTPMGTGGALVAAAVAISSDFFLLINGDTFIDFDVSKFITACTQTNQMGLVVTTVPDVSKTGWEIKITADGATYISSDGPSAGLINGGVYLLRKSFVEMLPKHPFSLEDKILKEGDVLKNLHLFQHDGRFIDMGTPEGLERAKATLC